MACEPCSQTASCPGRGRRQKGRLLDAFHVLTGLQGGLKLRQLLVLSPGPLTSDDCLDLSPLWNLSLCPSVRPGWAV